MRFGRLVVTERRLVGQPLVKCLCDCGTEIVVKFSALGHDRNSCGCLHRERASQLTAKHGMSTTRIYRIWSDMVRRCTWPNHQRYADYGGRGITVCKRWLEFENFYADMGDRPEGRSLDRINNDAGYSPENCRWATGSQQAKNRRPSAYAGSRQDPASGRFLPKGDMA